MKFPYQAKAYTEDIEDYTYKHDITLKGENWSLAAYHAWTWLYIPLISLLEDYTSLAKA